MAEDLDLMTLDDFTALEVEMKVMHRVCDLLPTRVKDYSPRGRYRLGDYVTEDDYRHGVRASFSGEPGFEEWMVTPLVEAFHRHKRDMAQARDFAKLLVVSVFGQPRRDHHPA